jgi:hypothetical protein
MAKTLIVRLEATILDDLNCKATSSAYALVDPTASFADVLSVQNTWLADLDACTDGQIISTELEVVPALPDGLKSAPVAGSRIEQSGVLDFNATGDGHLWGFLVPAISNSDTVLLAGRPVITTGAPLNTLFSLLAGGGTTTLAWTNATSQILAGFAHCFLGIRTYPRQLARATFERA